MKPVSFVFDQRLYELLNEGGGRQFTTQELRDAYAKRLVDDSFGLTDLRLYLHEQIRRMIRVGWVAAEVRDHNQVYRLRPIPTHLNVKLVEIGCEESMNLPAAYKLASGTVCEQSTDVLSHAELHLEALYKELELDFHSSMGRRASDRQVFDDSSHIRRKDEHKNVDILYYSSRLLCHLRAIELILKGIRGKSAKKATEL